MSYGTTRGNPYEALVDVTLSVRRGDFFCLLGPSGCGKSTLLSLIAGFELPTSGSITLGSTEIAEPGVDRVLLFQDASAALFPWLTVRENVEFGPRMRGIPRARSRPDVDAFIELVHLTSHASKFPHQLSGGMKQRLQIARALVNHPEMLLMDEPFAALDAITKRGLQLELSRIWQQTGVTVVYVTHDLIEALLLSTHVAIMSAGPRAHIKDVVRIDLPSTDRTPSSSRFSELHKHLEGLLREEARLDAVEAST
jgi:NitT/TauT family transport system ATP-binding protein